MCVFRPKRQDVPDLYVFLYPFFINKLLKQQSNKKLQDAFPSYSENFPTWSQHTSAMHQLAVWTMLEDAGLGASLQHYNPLIDDEVRRTWNLPESWMLIAEMPFGTPTAEPGEKEFGELSERIKIFR
jgi:uncharacterized protein